MHHRFAPSRLDGLLTWFGHYVNLSGEYDLTLELVLGYVCYPTTFLLGVSREGEDLLLVGRLIGLKVIANEFVAYSALQVADDARSPYRSSRRAHASSRRTHSADSATSEAWAPRSASSASSARRAAVTSPSSPQRSPARVWQVC